MNPIVNKALHVIHLNVFDPEIDQEVARDALSNLNLLQALHTLETHRFLPESFTTRFASFIKNNRLTMRLESRETLISNVDDEENVSSHSSSGWANNWELFCIISCIVMSHLNLLNEGDVQSRLEKIFCHKNNAKNIGYLSAFCTHDTPPAIFNNPAIAEITFNKLVALEKKLGSSSLERIIESAMEDKVLSIPDSPELLDCLLSKATYYNFDDLNQALFFIHSCCNPFSAKILQQQLLIIILNTPNNEDVSGFLHALGRGQVLRQDIESYCKNFISHYQSIIKIFTANVVKKFSERLSDIGYNHENIPSHYCCPITLSIMNDPITISSGYTFDRIALLQLNHGKAVGTFKCPITKKDIPIDEVNIGTTILIRDWIEAFVIEKESEFGKKNQPTVARSASLAFFDKSLSNGSSALVPVSTQPQ